MSDERTRALERRAAQGDRDAAAALARARCRSSTDHGAVVEVAGLLTQRLGLWYEPRPEVTLTRSACAACQEEVPPPDVRLIHAALRGRRVDLAPCDVWVDPSGQRFGGRIAMDCRGGHAFDEGLLYLHGAPGSESEVFRSCIRCTYREVIARSDPGLSGAIEVGTIVAIAPDGTLRRAEPGDARLGVAAGGVIAQAGAFELVMPPIDPAGEAARPPRRRRRGRRRR